MNVWSQIKAPQHANSPVAFLMQKAIEKKQASLGPHGELVVYTGQHTGRSADDKYVVKTSETEQKIWWENNIRAMESAKFELLLNDVQSYLGQQAELFSTERSIGHSGHFAVNIDFISEMPSAVMFTQYMFKGMQASAQDRYQILHAPLMRVDPAKYGLRAPTAVVTCFVKKITIIIGTLYAGEIKKSMFSVMNYLLPDHGILPMHAGANLNSQGQSFVFFGLSGTGKTTLSTDQGTKLIGDDEHGLSDKGLFNFEGGCYAKTHKLSAETEPAIYSASTRFSSFLENVKINDQGQFDFNDSSITENGRSSYPLDFIADKVEDGTGPVPQHLFFLSADAFGVLPPVAKLSRKQAMEYFVLGYTAKLAGTEVGLKAPKAAFSTCFGAPFMLRHPSVYAKLLGQMMEKHNMTVWLVNTGWTGGAYGVGQRFALKTTRELIRAVQAGELQNVPFVEDKNFGIMIPEKVREIPSKILQPQSAWQDAKAYEVQAQQLASSFKQQVEKFALT